VVPVQGLLREELDQLLPALALELVDLLDAQGLKIGGLQIIDALVLPVALGSRLDDAKNSGV